MPILATASAGLASGSQRGFAGVRESLPLSCDAEMISPDWLGGTVFNLSITFWSAQFSLLIFLQLLTLFWPFYLVCPECLFSPRGRSPWLTLLVRVCPPQDRLAPVTPHAFVAAPGTRPCTDSCLVFWVGWESLKIYPDLVLFNGKVCSLLGVGQI